MMFFFVFRSDLSNGSLDIFNKDTEADEEKENSILEDPYERQKKSVKFADGIKPGEGTSPSGGEGDMPSPPPPVSARQANLKDAHSFDLLKMTRTRKLRKKAKRSKLPREKTKKKVKVIIKFKIHIIFSYFKVILKN